ncbi:uncharacterized protein LOC103505946 [Diaphorina citri]|uniref:Uncharacterized protein LOC103505946 n=1 Tax=Diaphorina citri TaxID=121845 RepID=A0A3Q0IKX4_DIACI|nr:uncharacterized protein LOC103505946 [Diaphorina citri]
MFITKMMKFLFSNAALEKTILLSMISLAISENCSINLMFQKACDKEASSPIYLGKMCPNEKAAQTETTSYNISKSMIYSLLVSLVLMYAGTWSDSHGKRRKPLVVIPLIGQLITDVANVICSNIWTISGYTVAILNGLLPGITGGRLLLFTGAVCYISDTTGVEIRTFRIGILAALYFIATPIGDSLSGVLSVRYGFEFVFTLCIVLNILALINCIHFMLDSSEDFDDNHVESFCVQIVDNFRVVTKKRPNRSRLIVVLALIASPLVRSPMIGESSVLYLFVRYKFGWNEADYGFYAAFQLIGLFIGKKLLKRGNNVIATCNDINLGLFKQASEGYQNFQKDIQKKADESAGASILSPLVSKLNAVGSMIDRSNHVLFNGAHAGIDTLAGHTRNNLNVIKPYVKDMSKSKKYQAQSSVICSSILSKHVEPHEVGKISSVKGFLESIAPFLATPLYNFVYMHTIDYLPSAFYIVSVIFGLPIFVIFGIIRLAERNTAAYEDPSPKDKTKQWQQYSPGAKRNFLSIAPSVATPLYNFVYIHTFEYLPSGYYIISICIGLPIFLIFCNRSRLIVVLALIASPLVRSPMIGESSVLYLFVRYKFGWNEADYGFYAAFQLIGLFIGTLISLGIFSKYFGISDSLIGIFASVSDMTAAASYIFVNAPWQMFLRKMCPNEKAAQTETTSYNISKSMIYSLLFNSVKMFITKMMKFLFSNAALEKTILLSMISLAISENCSINLMFQKACDKEASSPIYLGQIITDLGNMICSYFWRTSSLAVSLINGFFPGVSGGRLLLFTGANAYVSDTTNHKDRTFRLGFVASLYCIATPVGDALSGILTVKLGFINVFFLCVAINTIALVIGLYCIRDTSEKYDPRDVEGFCDQMWGNVKVAIRKRPSTSRKIILLALLASPLVRSPILGIIFSLGFLSKKLGVADSKIALVASLMDMTSATLYLMVQSSWQMFVVPMVDIFHGAVQSICTSLLTKHVESHELGKITSVKAFLESIAPSVATPLYNFVYIHTFEYLPSGYYIISICIGLPIFLIFW